LGGCMGGLLRSRLLHAGVSGCSFMHACMYRAHMLSSGASPRRLTAAADLLHAGGAVWVDYVIHDQREAHKVHRCCCCCCYVMVLTWWQGLEWWWCWWWPRCCCCGFEKQAPAAVRACAAVPIDAQLDCGLIQLPLAALLLTVGCLQQA
jgi:hypothetical protein